MSNEGKLMVQVTLKDLSLVILDGDVPYEVYLSHAPDSGEISAEAHSPQSFTLAQLISDEPAVQKNQIFLEARGLLEADAELRGLYCADTILSSPPRTTGTCLASQGKLTYFI